MAEYFRPRNNVRTIVFRIKNDNYEFLLLKNGRKNYLQNPQGGKDEERETEKMAAFRETREETGLENLIIIEALKTTEDIRETINYFAKRNGERRSVHLVAYALLAEPDAKVKISDEHSSFGWFSYEEALEKLNKYPEQEDIFVRVCEKMGVPEP